MIKRPEMNAPRASIVCALVAMALVLAACASPGAPVADGSSGASPAAASASISGSVPPVTGAGRVLVVYFTQGSATRRVAEDLAALTAADIEVIVEKKARKGFFGFMGAGMDATFGTATAIEPPTLDPSDYDALYVCSPVWSWSLCPPVRTWLRIFRGRLPRTAFVTVSGDTEPGKIVKAMTKEGGAQPFAFMGFAERDFYPENREGYAGKIAELVEPLR